MSGKRSTGKPNQLALMATLARYYDWQYERAAKLAKSKEIFRHGVAAGRAKMTVSVK